MNHSDLTKLNLCTISRTKIIIVSFNEDLNELSHYLENTATLVPSNSGICDVGVTLVTDQRSEIYSSSNISAALALMNMVVKSKLYGKIFVFIILVEYSPSSTILRSSSVWADGSVTLVPVYRLPLCMIQIKKLFWSWNAHMIELICLPHFNLY